MRAGAREACQWEGGSESDLPGRLPMPDELDGGASSRAGHDPGRSVAGHWQPACANGGPQSRFRRLPLSALSSGSLPGPAKNIHGPLGPGQARTVEPAALTCTGTEDPPAAVRLAGTAQLAPRRDWGQTGEDPSNGNRGEASHLQHADGVAGSFV